jgi:hypothetical protein
MDAAQTAAKVSAAASTSVNPSAPLKPSDPKIECSDYDPEDDVPLSDLARVSSDDQHVCSASTSVNPFKPSDSKFS